MKLTVSLFFVFCSFTVSLSFSQSSKQITSDLLKFFNRISYCAEKGRHTTNDFDVLGNANEALSKRLEYYSNIDPVIMGSVFKNLGGAISDDKLVRIISWDTRMGGTQHLFESIIQYKTGKCTISATDIIKDQDGYVYNLDRLYTLHNNGKIYYLISYYGIFDLYERAEGIRVFTIENGRLTVAKLIKTQSGLTDRLYFKYNQHLTNSDVMSEVTMDYNPEEKTITFPVISQDGQQTDNQIDYKFNGLCFEKVGK